MVVQPDLSRPHDQDQHGRHGDKEQAYDRVGDKGVKRPLGKILRVVERVPLLPTYRKAGPQEHQSCRVK